MGYGCLGDFSKNQSIQPLPNSLVGIRQDVTVAIHGGLDGGLACFAPNQTFGKTNGGAGVAELILKREPIQGEHLGEPFARLVAPPGLL